MSDSNGGGEYNPSFHYSPPTITSTTTTSNNNISLNNVNANQMQNNQISNHQHQQFTYNPTPNNSFVPSNQIQQQQPNQPPHFASSSNSLTAALLSSRKRLLEQPTQQTQIQTKPQQSNQFAENSNVRYSEDEESNTNTNTNANKRRKTSTDKTISNFQTNSISSSFEDQNQADAAIENNNGEQSNLQSNKFLKMMKAQGWQEGQGLGKNLSGISEPINPNNQLDKTGLGFAQKLITKSHTVDLNKYYPHHQTADPLKHPANWKYIENKLTQNDIKIETEVVDLKEEDSYMKNKHFISEPNLLQELFKLKQRLDPLPRPAFKSARDKSNPYESIGKHIFMNRAALKMANMDKIFDFLGETRVPLTETLYFADICAAPGGFTQFISYKRPRSKGFGLSLKDKHCEWDRTGKLPGNFDISYGQDQTGDITKLENISAFKSLIYSKTGNRGVHFVVGDGGADVEGNENNQELLMKRLVLCQFLTMFNILQAGGNFMCKVFDTFSPFTIGLLYLLFRHFDTFYLIKPFTSRPANSERYVVCMGLLEVRPTIAIETLNKINEELGKFDKERHQSSNVSMRTISKFLDVKDTQFLEYVKKKNSEIARGQIENLDLLLKYVEDPSLQLINQEEVRKRCLEEWGFDPGEKKNAPNYDVNQTSSTTTTTYSSNDPPVDVAKLSEKTKKQANTSRRRKPDSTQPPPK